MRRRWATAALLALACSLSLSPPALATGDINTPGCPFQTESSPGFQSELPDCRAYELVSPAYAGGAIASGVESLAPPISPDGDHLLAISFGDFAGTEDLAQNGTEYGAVYQFNRTATGWSAEAQDPPAALYPRRIIETHGMSPSDLGRTVWLLYDNPDPGEEGEIRNHEWVDSNSAVLAVREPDGEGHATFHILGPGSAPGHDEHPAFTYEAEPAVVTGISNDVTHVVITVKDQSRELWPGDSTTQGESLYQYTTTGPKEPELLAVKNAGPAPWVPAAAHLNEGAQLISRCGSTYDAISADGSRVILTTPHVAGCSAAQPRVSEIYARVNSSQTIAVSQPDSSDCSACDTTPQAQEQAPAGAVFQDATEDGTGILFTTRQALLGSTGEGQGLYLYDSGAPAGERVTRIAPETAPGAIVSADGRRVYFTSTAALTSQANANGETAMTGAPNLYLYDTTSRETVFVASAEHATALQATPDGQYLIFQSTEHLHEPQDTSTVPQIFQYDAATGVLSRVSIGRQSPGGYRCQTTGLIEAGYGCDGNTGIAEDAPRPVQAPGRSLAADGTVVFSSELALTPGAVPGVTLLKSNGSLLADQENIYEYRQGQVYLISAAGEANPAHYQSPEQSRLLGIDEEGANIFFATTTSLLPQDTDTQSSWYDARADGGFPAPNKPSACEGEACQGPAAPQPTLPTAGGSALTPPQALLPPPSAQAHTSIQTPAQQRAAKLNTALKACLKIHRAARRSGCRRAARKRYGPLPAAARNSSVHRR